MTQDDAMAVAEAETGGEALSAHRIDLNAATGGYEVMVRMPEKERGYRVVIDVDTRRVRDTYAIPNPLGLPPNPQEGPRDEPSQKSAAKFQAENGHFAGGPSATGQAPAMSPVTSSKAGSELFVWRDSKGVVNITSYPPPEGCNGI